MKYILIIFSVILIGCSNTIEIPKEVYIPVKCKVTKTTKPTLTNQLDELNFKKIYEDNTSIMIYSEIISNDLNYCLGENNDK